jgi:hypothetical protein
LSKFLGFTVEVKVSVSFTRNIRPLFHDQPDVETMKRMGIDLSSYEDVKANSEGIYARLENGTMPCYGPWPLEQVALFKRWMDEGMAP